MRSVRNARFRKAFDRLPDPVRERARARYGLFRADPFHPQLDFHEIQGTRTKGVYAVDVGSHMKTAYRALGVWEKQRDIIVWFWIGSHEDYNNILKRL